MNLSMFLMMGLFSLPFLTRAAELNAGDKAPAFKTKTQNGEDFDLATRQGRWSVLYFYPKADTPGCTKQACTFRNNIKKITEQGADVFGVSVNTPAEQKAFYDKHKLNFTLLADDGEITKLYGAKMPVVNIAKRWTFVIDPELKIRAIKKDVDPVKDAGQVADLITQFKGLTK